ncbi:MAG: hypothetical protein ACLFV8_04020, partial [Alphaproteobacteria bacterium]
VLPDEAGKLDDAPEEGSGPGADELDQPEEEIGEPGQGEALPSSDGGPEEEDAGEGREDGSG